VAAHRVDCGMKDEVEVQRGETTNKLFIFVSAITKVTSEPNGAEIFIDGKSRGHTPLRLDLPVRFHELVAHLAGWPDEQQKIDFDAKREKTAHFVFAKDSVN